MTTYYVDPQGSNDNSGDSVDSPFADFGPIEGGVLSAGDTVKVLDGTFNLTPSIDLTGISGQSDSRIVIEPYQNATPTLDFGGADGSGFVVTGSDYVTIQGLELTNCGHHGIKVHDDANFNSFRNLEIHNFGFGSSPGGSGIIGAGLNAKGPNDTLIEGCLIYDSHGGSGGDGLHITRGATNTTVRDTEIHHCSDDAIDFKGASPHDPDEPALFERVICRDSGQNLDGSVTGDGNGFKFGDSDERSGGHKLVRCVAFRNDSRGIGNPSVDVPVTLWNCAAVENGSQNIYLTDGAAHEIVNSLAQGGSGWDVRLSGSATVTTCNFRDDGGNFNADWGCTFKSTDPSSSDFLVPADGSKAIDAGTDVGLAYNGDAPDLGAYEHGDSTDDTSSSTGTAVIRVYDGGQWKRAPVRYYDGQGFVPVGN